MNQNVSAPVLNADGVYALSDEQLVAWYSRHPNPTVRALIGRIAFMTEKHVGELLQAYQDGYDAAVDHLHSPDVKGLTPEELRLSTIQSEWFDEL